MTGGRSNKAEELRRRAEEMAAAREARRGPHTSDPVRLLQELEVHQIELELQNEELVRTHLEAEAVSRRYTELFDFAPIGYVVLDVLGHIREASLETGRMLGVPREALMGRRFGLFVAIDQREGFADFLGRVLTSGDESSPSQVFNCDLSAEGATVRHVRAVASALKDPVATAMVALIDTTSLRRAEAALRDEAARKDEFIAALSHELRNPLSPIRSGLAIVARATPGGDEARKAMSMITRQVDQLVNLVDDLLDVTRIASGKVRLVRERVDLGTLVLRTIDDHRAEFKAKGISLVETFDGGPFFVDADPTRITQAVGNLLNNALKFSSRGGHVEVALRDQQGEAFLSIRDDGVGFAPEMRERLFEPFVQAAQTLDRSAGGLGLGLAMVKGFIELHGGTVDARSDGAGRGASFVVRLPLTSSGPPTAAPAERAEAPHRRILVIDDNADSADAQRDLLVMAGHEACSAYDGPSGLALAKTFHPEIVLCDIGLPGMDGYAVARALRADRDSRDVYLVAISGYAASDDLRRATEAGFDRHIAKPPSEEAVENVLLEAPRSTTGA